MELLRGIFSYSPQETALLNSQDDLPLIIKHSNIRTHVINIAPDTQVSLRLRIFNLPHQKGHKLPPLPFVLLIHGLGGQLTQFEALIDYFSYFATVIAVDLPGCGMSEYCSDTRVYTQQSLVLILESVFNSLASNNMQQEVVLVGHSMGCVLAARLAQKLGPLRCIGLVAICPPPSAIDPKLQRSRKMLGYMPAFVFDIFRSMDRRGGLNSASVNRMVAPKASDEIRQKQLRWNLQVNTRAWMAMAYNFSALTPAEWGKIDCPVFLVGAQNDIVTPPDTTILQIQQWLGSKSSDIEPVILHDAGHAVMIEKPNALCAVISDFIQKHVEVKLSLAWQLAFLASKMDKWSLKNEKKWQGVQGVGDVVQGCNLRGMKTLRQDDQSHSPAIVERDYPDITDIIDISREPPPYDPQTFRRIRYHKFPTVSKIPPSEKEVNAFIELVKQINSDSSTNRIAVHCHYGFNRTGFFITSYLIAEKHISIPQALEAYKISRPPGIKHPHFIDELYRRYEL